MAINNIPMTNADIITGVSLMLLFVFAFGAFNASLGQVLRHHPAHRASAPCCIAHITFDVPYVISVGDAQAAASWTPTSLRRPMDLGATPWRRFPEGGAARADARHRQRGAASPSP